MKLENVLVANERRRPEEELETGDAPGDVDVGMGSPQCWDGKLGNIPIGSMVLLYMVTFTINIPPMLAYIPNMDPMGYGIFMAF
jgi:hypothetical protein